MFAIMNDYDQKMVKDLKDVLSEVATDEFTDFDYLRWLQGHDYNMAVIVPLLRHHFLVLRSYDFDNFDRMTEATEKYTPTGLIRLSGKGHYFPYIETQGAWDGDGVMKSCSKTDMALHRMYIGEQILKLMRKHESESGCQSGMIYIIDAEGAEITAKNVALLSGPYKDLAQLLFKHYAEMFHKLIIVNAPMIIWVMYNIVKPVIPEKSRQKFIVLGSTWKTDILQYCDPDTLPVHYGGTFVDENNDPKCASKIVYCTKVPEKLYWSPSNADPKPEDLTVLTVAAGSSTFVTVEVTKEDTVLKWYYSTYSDWGFGIYFTENESESSLENMEMVFPHIDYFRGPSNVPEKGKIKCKKCGFYKLWIGNKFSWFTKLHISYKIDLL